MGLFFYNLEDFSIDEHYRNEERINAIKEAAAKKTTAIQKQTEQLAKNAKESAEMERKKIAQIGTLARQIEPLLQFSEVSVDDVRGKVDDHGAICFRASDIKEVREMKYSVMAEVECSQFPYTTTKYTIMNYRRILLWDGTYHNVSDSVENINERILDSVSRIQELHLLANKKEG